MGESCGQCGYCSELVKVWVHR